MGKGGVLGRGNISSPKANIAVHQILNIDCQFAREFDLACKFGASKLTIFNIGICC